MKQICGSLKLKLSKYHKVEDVDAMTLLHNGGARLIDVFKGYPFDREFQSSTFSCSLVTFLVKQLDCFSISCG